MGEDGGQVCSRQVCFRFRRGGVCAWRRGPATAGGRCQRRPSASAAVSVCACDTRQPGQALGEQRAAAAGVPARGPVWETASASSQLLHCRHSCAPTARARVPERRAPDDGYAQGARGAGPSLVCIVRCTYQRAQNMHRTTFGACTDRCMHECVVGSERGAGPSLRAHVNKHCSVHLSTCTKHAPNNVRCMHRSVHARVRGTFRAPIVQVLCA